MATAEPRGKRNRSPLNLMGGHIPWDGMTGVDPDGYTVFGDKSGVAGARAGMLDLLNDHIQDGRKTILSLLSEFAPKEHNNPTRKYADFVAKRLGVTAEAPIDLTDRETLVNMAYAMARFEQGGDYWPRSTFEKAADLALQKRRIKPKAEQAKEIATATLGPVAAVEPLNQALTALTPLGDLPGVKWAVIGLSLTLAGIGIYLAIRGRK